MLTAIAAGVALAAGGLAFAGPAQAAPSDVDDATLTWGLNGYAQRGIFGPWIFSGLSENVEYLSGATQTEYVTAPFPATSFPTNATSGPNPNAVKFTQGAGTVDPATGAAVLSWEGSYTVNAYPAQFNAPDEVYSDPQLTVAADGSGELSFEFTLGGGVDMEGNPIVPTDYGRMTLATFSAGSISGLDDDSFRLSPDFAGVTLDPAVVSGQVTTCTAPSQAGSWPVEFVETLVGDPAGSSIAPHFYSTGCGGLNDAKPALPLDIGFALSETPVEPEPEYGAGDIIVEVPEEETVPEPETGAFEWAWSSNSAVDLGTAAVDGNNFRATGALTPVIVTDTRAGGAGSFSWSLSGQVGDFAAGSNSFGGSALGWTPQVISGSATAGAATQSSTLGGAGLGAPAQLANGSGNATAGADLTLVIPGTTPAGDYQATLTITATQ